jgi:hypothetical protein
VRTAIASLVVRAMAPAPSPPAGPFGQIREVTRRNLAVQRRLRAVFGVGDDGDPGGGEHEPQ